MANESIEFDIRVDGKPAKKSIKEVEKAQKHFLVARMNKKILK